MGQIFWTCANISAALRIVRIIITKSKVTTNALVFIPNNFFQGGESIPWIFCYKIWVFYSDILLAFGFFTTKRIKKNYRNECRYRNRSTFFETMTGIAKLLGSTVSTSAGWFLGFKTKVTSTTASKFCRSGNLINPKLLSKFHSVYI